MAGLVYRPQHTMRWRLSEERTRPVESLDPAGAMPGCPRLLKEFELQTAKTVDREISRMADDSDIFVWSATRPQARHMRVRLFTQRRHPSCSTRCCS